MDEKELMELVRKISKNTNIVTDLLKGNVLTKQEAIGIVKGCDNTQDFTTNNMCGTINGYTMEEHKKEFPDIPDKHRIRQFCDICQFLINRFKIKEKDLE